MTRFAIALAAAKAIASSLALSLLVGLLFAGINQGNEWLFLDDCARTRSVLCSVPRFWASWWWAIYLLVFYPLWIAFLALFIRKFATSGSRLAAAGFACAFFGAWMLLAATHVVPAYGVGIGIAIYLAVGVALISVGLYLGLRQAAQA